jgi:hypothetical protein
MIPIWLIVLAFIAAVVAAGLTIVLSADPAGRGSEYALRAFVACALCLVFAIGASAYDIWRHFFL